MFELFDPAPLHPLLLHLLKSAGLLDFPVGQADLSVVLAQRANVVGN